MKEKTELRFQLGAKQAIKTIVGKEQSKIEMICLLCFKSMLRISSCYSMCFFVIKRACSGTEK